MNRLALVVGGPTKDYATDFSENVAGAEPAANGAYSYTLKTAIPQDAQGTWSVGIEGYRNITIQTRGDTTTAVRDAGNNDALHFPVTDAEAQPRRQVVAIEKCNSCHFQLAAHGDTRNRIEQCVICHNPKATDSERRPATDQPAQGIDFRTMIHRIHTGSELPMDYSIYGFGNEKINFNHVEFPGDRRNCAECHVNDSQQLPLPEGLLPVVDPLGPINPMGPATAACLSCHASQDAASHAVANTTELGESCSACHGAEREFSVSRVHAR
jgi:OmcA/MtrC family decaheme c-type cytochrome